MIKVETPKAAYFLLTCLCLFMVTWIHIFPGSWKLGWNESHDQFVAWMLQHNPTHVTPPATVTKYSGHYAVQFSHILPGSIWASIIPIQLSPSFRHSYPYLHKILGYIFTFTGCVMMIGLGIIDARKLYWFENDYPEIIDTIPIWWHVCLRFQNRALLVWFLYSLCKAVSYARSKRFHMHEVWMIRHIASGIWVAVQRLYVIYMEDENNTPAQMKLNFEVGGMLAVGLCFGLAEMYIAGWKKQIQAHFCNTSTSFPEKKSL